MVEKHALKAVRGGGARAPPFHGVLGSALGCSIPWAQSFPGVGDGDPGVLGWACGCIAPWQGVGGTVDRARYATRALPASPASRIIPFHPQASSEKIWRAGKLLFIHLTSTRPGLIRDHKHHLRHHRWDGQHPCHAGGHRGLPRTPAALRGQQNFSCPSQGGVHPGCQVPWLRFGADSHALSPCRQCCSGKELVDWLLSAGLAVQTRSQAIGICQVLVDGGVLTHGEGGRWQPPARRRGLARRDGRAGGC